MCLKTFIMLSNLLYWIQHVTIIETVFKGLLDSELVFREKRIGAEFYDKEH